MNFNNITINLFLNMNKFARFLFLGIHILTLSQNNSLNCEHIEMPNVFTPK